MGRIRKTAKAAVIHKVESIDFEGPFLLLKVDGRKHKIDLRSQSKLLAEADERVKRHYVVSPAGYGIHWPEIDEDLSIDGMIRSTRKRKKNGRS